MHANPSLILIIVCILGIGVALALMLVGALWARVRSIPVAETTRIVDNLARRQESLEAVLARLDAGRDAELEPKPPTVSNSVGSEVTRPQAPQRADPARASAIGGPTLIVVPSLAAPLPDESAAVASELGRRFGAIWELADAGETPESIARSTGQPIGQVELILGLRRGLSTGEGSRT